MGRAAAPAEPRGFVGGIEEGGGPRQVGRKALIVVAAEVRGRGTGGIRLGRVLDSSAPSILPFVRGAVASGALVITNGLPTYLGLPEAGYGHRRLVIRGSGAKPDAVLPRVHRVVALLKRWLLVTHQGAVDRAPLPYYLDECAFRFNRRTSRRRGLLFYRLVQQALAVDPAPYGVLVGGVELQAPQDAGVT